MIGDWGEVVTRYPYRKVGMDHLLSRSTSSLELEHFRSSPRVSISCICSWSPTPQFSGVFTLGVLPDIWIDEQDHRKVAESTSLESSSERETANRTEISLVTTRLSSTISVDARRDDVHASLKFDRLESRSG